MFTLLLIGQTTYTFEIEIKYTKTYYFSTLFLVQHNTTLKCREIQTPTYKIKKYCVFNLLQFDDELSTFKTKKYY